MSPYISLCTSSSRLYVASAIKNNHGPLPPTGSFPPSLALIRLNNSNFEYFNTPFTSVGIHQHNFNSDRLLAHKSTMSSSKVYPTKRSADHVSQDEADESSSRKNKTRRRISNENAGSNVSRVSLATLPPPPVSVALTLLVEGLLQPKACEHSNS
jgi:hypothetical protein